MSDIQTAAYIAMKNSVAHCLTDAERELVARHMGVTKEQLQSIPDSHALLAWFENNTFRDSNKRILAPDGITQLHFVLQRVLGYSHLATCAMSHYSNAFPSQ